MPQRFSSNRAQRIGHARLTCARCRSAIEPGVVHVRDHGQPVHPECLRLQIRPTTPGRLGQQPPRYLTDPHAGTPCEGCGTVLHADDVVVHVAARPWHAECRKGWRR